VIAILVTFTFRARVAIGKQGYAETFATPCELFDALCRGSGLKPFLTFARMLGTYGEEVLN
jgi:hypothetical protein